jgi:hypothetical protein
MRKEKGKGKRSGVEKRKGKIKNKIGGKEINCVLEIILIKILLGNWI